MIELRNLTKSYRLRNGERHYVFRDLNFSFPEGINIGLIGPNGAGKSTLLRLMGGIDFPDSGKVITNKRISWPIGLSGGLSPNMTARDSVKFVCRLLGVGREEMREKIRFVQEFAEIGEYFDQPVKSYSAGMRARVRFGLSWAFEFDYYLMDEIGAVGDARYKQKSQELMAERIGKSNVIMVSHSMAEIEKLCNVVVLVNNGQATLYENVEEGITAYEQIADVPLRKRKPVREPKELQQPAAAAQPEPEARRARRLAKLAAEGDAEAAQQLAELRRARRLARLAKEKETENQHAEKAE